MNHETPVFDRPITEVYDRYTVSLSAPLPLYRSPESDQVWGRHQFPKLRRTVDGAIIASWNYGEDKVGGSNKPHIMRSDDEGKTWSFDAGPHNFAATLRMKNGKYFAGFHSDGTPKADFLHSYPEVLGYTNVNGDHKMYFAEDIAADPVAVERNLTRLSFYEYDPDTDTTQRVDSTLNWPYAAMVLYPGGYAYSLSGILSLSGENVIAAADGTLYTCMYTTGFDSFAPTKEAAVSDCTRRGKFQVYVFESNDSGRTWDLISQLTAGEETDMDALGYEGYCEPKMIEMADGSFIMLMRTGGNSNPMYITRSADRGRTWTLPEIFDDLGVLPQLYRFDCGVTVAAYGRPWLRMCFTDDPLGKVWEKPIGIPLAGDNNGRGQSCFYTNLLRLTADTALLIYTSLRYPNDEGVGVRTVLTRTVTITPHM